MVSGALSACLRCWPSSYFRSGCCISGKTIAEPPVNLLLAPPIKAEPEAVQVASIVFQVFGVTRPEIKSIPPALVARAPFSVGCFAVKCFLSLNPVMCTTAVASLRHHKTSFTCILLRRLVSIFIVIFEAHTCFLFRNVLIFQSRKMVTLTIAMVGSKVFLPVRS